MVSKLRHKIFIGILLLAILLAASGSMVLYQFLILNSTVNQLIEDNYKTIYACQNMLDALEREDSGILLLSLGNWEEGRHIIRSADSTFNASFSISANNLTEENEDQYVKKVKENYTAFKKKWEKPIVNTSKQGNLEWYIDEINGDFLKTKESVYSLMVLNQKSMYEEASLLKERAYRAIMPGIVSVVAVILFAFLFNFFLFKSFIKPLNSLTETTRKYTPNQPKFQSNIKADDEFKELEGSIRDMIARQKRYYEDRDHTT